MTTVRLADNASIPLKYANRHGLVTGQTGTGKSVTLLTLVEGLTEAGTPVVMIDVKGDMSAIARSRPTALWDVYGEAGAQLTVSLEDFGPDLVARMMDLTSVQSGVLDIVWAYARDNRKSIHSLHDLRSILRTVGTRIDHVSTRYGHVTKGSLGVIQRGCLRLHDLDTFIGRSSFTVSRFLEVPGVVHLVDGQRLTQSPGTYAAVMLWLIERLFRELPEAGDQVRPRLAVVVDEAHLVFKGCPEFLLRRLEQALRLLRSKGVGIYFASQSPNDVPDIVREQLGTTIRHDRNLGIGTAVVDTYAADGRMTGARRARIDLPSCTLGPISDDERRLLISQIGGGDRRSSGTISGSARLVRDAVIGALIWTLGIGAVAAYAMT